MASEGDNYIIIASPFTEQINAKLPKRDSSCIGNQNSNWATDKEREFITWLFIVYLNPFCILTFEKSSKFQR